MALKIGTRIEHKIYGKATITYVAPGNIYYLKSDDGRPFSLSPGHKSIREAIRKEAS